MADIFLFCLYRKSIFLETVASLIRSSSFNSCGCDLLLNNLTFLIDLYNFREPVERIQNTKSILGLLIIEKTVRYRKTWSKGRDSSLTFLLTTRFDLVILIAHLKLSIFCSFNAFAPRSLAILSQWLSITTVMYQPSNVSKLQNVFSIEKGGTTLTLYQYLKRIYRSILSHTQQWPSTEMDQLPVRTFTKKFFYTGIWGLLKI